MEEKKNNEVVSGALREALESRLLQWRKIHASTKGQWRTNYEEGRDNMLMDCIEGLAADIQKFDSLLSLSSPIEPPRTITPQMMSGVFAKSVNNTDPEHDHVYDHRIAAAEINRLLGTPQASSEIREALRVAHLYILRNDRWSEPVLCRACLKSAMLAKDIQHVEGCLYVRIEALLTPSRQGAKK